VKSDKVLSAKAKSGHTLFLANAYQGYSQVNCLSLVASLCLYHSLLLTVGPLYNSLTVCHLSGPTNTPPLSLAHAD
jgi:hypothetical protein